MASLFKVYIFLKVTTNVLFCTSSFDLSFNFSESTPNRVNYTQLSYACPPTNQAEWKSTLKINTAAINRCGYLSPGGFARLKHLSLSESVFENNLWACAPH